MIVEAWKKMSIVDKHKTSNMEKRLNTFYRKHTESSLIDFQNKIIADYGCGGGFFGKYAFKNLKIKKYYGLDILQECLTYTKNNLMFQGYNNFELYKVDPWEMMDIIHYRDVDIFVCFSVIQHFITKKYLDTFLEALNDRKIETLILHFRFGDKTFFFQDRTYETVKSIVYACFTNNGYISRFLTNYELIGKQENVGYWRLKK